MSLHVDTDALQNQTLPALNKSKENLSSAREIISSIDIPSDFRYASTIRKIINDMENTEKTTDTGSERNQEFRKDNTDHRTFAGIKKKKP